MKCPNCSEVIITEDLYPKIVFLFREYHGNDDIWINETKDIAQEVCNTCGTMPEFLDFIEQQLKDESIDSKKSIVKEIKDNLHVPFLLQLCAPFFVYLLNTESEVIQHQTIELMGTIGNLDDIGRFVMSSFDSNLRIMSIKGLEQIAKHEIKRGRTFDWKDHLEYIINQDFDPSNAITQIRSFLKMKPRFIRNYTKTIILDLLKEIEGELC